MRKSILVCDHCGHELTDDEKLETVKGKDLCPACYGALMADMKKAQKTIDAIHVKHDEEVAAVYEKFRKEWGISLAKTTASVETKDEQTEPATAKKAFSNEDLNRVNKEETSKGKAIIFDFRDFDKMINDFLRGRV